MAGAEQLDRRGPGGDPKFHDESLMPVTMGTPYRVPDYAYPNWGLVYRDESLADEAYRSEWAAGNAGQLALVTQATVEAGLGDYPDLLRQNAAKAVGTLLKYRTSGGVRVIDIGSGPGTSVMAIYEALPDHLKEDTEFVLVDPSRGALNSAEKILTERGVNFKIREGSDSDVLPTLDPESVDIVVGVASVHHHARIPLEEYHRVLKPGGFTGFLVLADWHQPIWEHPGSVYQFLQQMDWPRKEEGLADWLRVYPNAVDAPPAPRNPVDRQAIIEITEFWKAYQRISREANLGPNAIWPLEGHRPVGKYEGSIMRAGFSLYTPWIASLSDNGLGPNPHQILPDSSLLQLTVGQKV